MAAKKYLALIAGAISEVFATVVSAGAADGGKIVALGDDGLLDATLMPSGIGANMGAASASEAIAARDLVNVYNDAGIVKVRKADASTTGKEANGWAPAAIANGVDGTIQYGGQMTGLTGLTAGKRYLSDTTPGLSTDTPPAGTGKIVQVVGTAISATAMNVEIDNPIILA